MAARRRAMIAPAFAVALVACNALVGYDEFTKSMPGDTGTSSGGTSSGTTPPGDDDDTVGPFEGGPDAPSAKPRCDPTKPFGQDEVFEPDSDRQTKRAIMTRDELEVFWLRTETHPFEFRHATRASRDAAWGEPTTETLSPPATELGSIVLKGQKLYYFVVPSSDPAATYSALRNAGGGFAPGTKLSTSSVRPTFVMEADDGVYWSGITLVDGSSNEIIRRGNVQGTIIVGNDDVPNLHQYPSLDDHPVLPKSELVIYFSSTRTGLGAQGSTDIWRASRPSRADMFDAPVNMTEINSSTLDDPSWVSDDDCVILFDRSQHIHIARRPLP